MTYEEALQYIHSRPRFSAVTGLGRIRRLLAALGDPQEQGQFVHIGGTNGKGSTAAMTAACLQAAGYRTGLFTSPYLVQFEERFRIDGQMISPSELVDITFYVKQAEDALKADGMEPVNEFELVTAIGLCWFARRGCDYVVLEVGLGGRGDATNVLRQPACVCITSISLDHMAQLGGTVSEIAAEKAGIIKENCPVVTPASQDPAALAIIREACQMHHAPLHLSAPGEILRCDRNGAAFRIGEQTVEISLLGPYQIENAAAAWEICQVLGLSPRSAQIGLHNATWPGRLQLLSQSPMVLMDSAHNEAGAEVLAESLTALFPEYRPVLLMTMMADKAHAACIRRLSVLAARLYATTLPLPRALPPEAVAEEAVCPAYTGADLASALDMALGSLESGEMLVVCGSVYLAGAALPLLEEELDPMKHNTKAEGSASHG